VEEKLTLSLEDMSSLPNGAPLSVVVGREKFSVGRHEDRDWVLPDPSRQISRHHFDIEFITDAFYAIDRSAMGTRLVSTGDAIKGPHALQDGDILQIGQYRIIVQFGEVDVAPPTDSSMSDSTKFNDLERPQPAPSAVAPEISLPEVPEAQPVLATQHEAPAIEAEPGPVRPAPVAPPVQPDAMLTAFCDVFGQRSAHHGTLDPAKLGTELAEALRLLVTYVIVMEQDRRDRSIGVVQEPPPAIAANPLDMDIEADEAITRLFLDQSSGHVASSEALLSSIERLILHNRAQGEAQIPAVTGLLRGLSPDDIAYGVDTGLFGRVNKSKAWNRYVEAWENKSRRTDGRMLEVFRILFAEHYQQVLTRTANEAEQSGKT